MSDIRHRAVPDQAVCCGRQTSVGIGVVRLEAEKHGKTGRMGKICCFSRVFWLLRVEILGRQYLIIAFRSADGRTS